MKNTVKLFVTSYCLFLASVLCAQTPAFPGAEGYGRYATGGRGGAVYYVNSLADTNTGNSTTKEGTLRWCLNQSGAKTILFKVSGTVWLTSKLSISKPNVTIAGQSAPGDGVCIAGFPVEVSADNVIIRYLRFRMGDLKDISADGADALGGRFHSNIIIDHCSVSWSTDECCSFYNNSNFTLQWCIISESLNYSKHSKGAHGYGGIWGGFGASFHHNLMAHHKSRMPRLGPGANTTPTNELTDVRNNVYYNYAGEGCYGAEAMHCNIVNNYYKLGPAGATLSSTKKQKIIAIDKKTDNSFPAIDNLWGTFYIDGNVVEGQTNVTGNNWQYGVFNQFASKYGTVSQADRDAMKLTAPLATDVITTHTAQQAFDLVLSWAGCSLHRDTIDRRIVHEAQTGTAAYRGTQSNLWGIIDSQRDLLPAGATDTTLSWCDLTQTAPPADTNIDGIPDDWFAENVPAGSTANSLNAEGYTYLEVYLASLVAEVTNNQNGAPSSVKENAMNQQNIHFFLQNKTLTIQGETPIVQTEIYTVRGERIFTACKKANPQTVNLAALAQGIYILKVKQEGCEDVFVKKIII